MADRLTQLQDAINEMADHFCNSIGVLQASAVPGQFTGFEKSGIMKPPDPPEDYAPIFAQLIARTAKDIDVLIESLPSEDSSTELQAACLARLKQDNQIAAARLEEVVSRGEQLLEQIQQALHEIAISQLQSTSLANDTTTSGT